MSTCLHLSSRLASPGREATKLARPEKSSPAQFWRVWAFQVNGETEVGKKSKRKEQKAEQNSNTKITFNHLNSANVVTPQEFHSLEFKRLKRGTNDKGNNNFLSWTRQLTFLTSELLGSVVQVMMRDTARRVSLELEKSPGSIWRAKASM